MQVEALDEVLVVQGGALHGGASQLHGVHIGHRCDGTCAPHLIGHLIETRTHALSLELIRDGPTGALGCKAEGALLTQGIHLQHDTVCGHGKVLTRRIPVVDEVVDLLQRPHFLHTLGYLKPPLTGDLQILKVSLRRQFLA